MTCNIERRKACRVAAIVNVHTNDPALGEVLGVTRDVSLSGVFFYNASSSWHQGASIEYVLQLPSEVTLAADPLSVLCSGKIVRVEKTNSLAGIAVQIDSFCVLEEGGHHPDSIRQAPN
jgi:hypothetical protein